MSDKPKVALSAEDLERLIRTTIDGFGSVDAAELPHRLRERLRRQLEGRGDAEEILQSVLDARDGD